VPGEKSSFSPEDMSVRAAATFQSINSSIIKFIIERTGTAVK
jgi:hypothetical protein